LSYEGVGSIELLTGLEFYTVAIGPVAVDGGLRKHQSPAPVRLCDAL